MFRSQSCSVVATMPTFQTGAIAPDGALSDLSDQQQRRLKHQMGDFSRRRDHVGEIVLEGFSKKGRHCIHQVAAAIGLSHVSSGEGTSRSIRIFKTKLPPATLKKRRRTSTPKVDAAKSGNSNVDGSISQGEEAPSPTSISTLGSPPQSCASVGERCPVGPDHEAAIAMHEFATVTFLGKSQFTVDAEMAKDGKGAEACVPFSVDLVCVDLLREVDWATFWSPEGLRSSWRRW